MTVLAGVLATAVGRGPAGTALVVAAVGAGQLSVGWSNDWIDAARDRAAGRVDKPLAVGELPPRSVAVAAGCALVLCVPLSLASGWLAGAAHLVGVAAGLAYNVRLKRTVLSWVPYALAFGLLPAFVVLGLPGGPRPAAWVLGAGALLGAGAHFANVLPDLDEDRAAGVLGLPQRLGRVVSGVVAAVLLTAATVVLAVGPPGPPGPAAWAALAATVPLALAAVVAPRSRLPFVAAILAAAVDVALLVGTALG
ncbi:UbiA family prenyltransferase [Kitasatospora terrestris]|uniref:UbiA family prenyltransferase n=1 Tax=Kitasatospora terrestris TaxID=258051 RepID=UPI0031F1B932